MLVGDHFPQKNQRRLFAFASVSIFLSFLADILLLLLFVALGLSNFLYTVFPLGVLYPRHSQLAAGYTRAPSMQYREAFIGVSQPIACPGCPCSCNL